MQWYLEKWKWQVDSRTNHRSDYVLKVVTKPSNNSTKPLYWKAKKENMKHSSSINRNKIYSTVTELKTLSTVLENTDNWSKTKNQIHRSSNAVIWRQTENGACLAHTRDWCWNGETSFRSCNCWLTLQIFVLVLVELLDSNIAIQRECFLHRG